LEHGDSIRIVICPTSPPGAGGARARFRAAFHADANRALVCFVGRPATMHSDIASAGLRASEGAALGANVAV